MITMGVKGKVLIEIYAQKFVCPFILDYICVTNSAQFEYFGRVIRFPYFVAIVSRLILILAPLGLKIIYFVFPTLTAILLALNQFPNFWISRLTLSMSRGRSVSESKPAVSSAYNTVRRLVAKCRSLMKHRNRMGPRMLPCNTEMLIALFVDFTPEISVNWVLFDK